MHMHRFTINKEDKKIKIDILINQNWWLCCELSSNLLTEDPHLILRGFEYVELRFGIGDDVEHNKTSEVVQQEGRINNDKYAQK